MPFLYLHGGERKQMNNEKKITQADRQLKFMEFLFADKDKDEYICVFGTDKTDTNKSTTKHFKGIKNAINYINKIRGYYNVYVSLATTDGTGRATENLLSRNVIALDFDIKDLGTGFNYKDIMHIFKQQGLYYHMLVNSGNGFHVYLKTDRTEDISTLVEINKAICQRVGADINACKTTQVLRVPNTYNYKDDAKKQVRGIFQADKIINYNADNLYKKFVFNTKIEETNLKYVATKNMPPCIIEILKGVAEGERDFCLGRLTKYFQLQNNSYNQALAIIKEWNNRNTPPIADNSLEYHFKKYWEGNYLLMGCKTDDPSIQSIISKYCNQFECNKGDKFEAIYTNGDELIRFSYKELDRMKFKKGRKIMLNGNHVVLITILRQQVQGLNYKQLEEELTSTITGKCCMSKKTILNVLDELKELGIIDKFEGNRKTIPTLYKIKDIDLVEKEHLAINHHAIRRYIDGAVGQSALRVYVYMKYRLQKGENVVQEEIADNLGITQQALSKTMKELERARYITTSLDFSVCKRGANIYKFM